LLATPYGPATPLAASQTNASARAPVPSQSARSCALADDSDFDSTAENRKVYARTNAHCRSDARTDRNDNYRNSMSSRGGHATAHAHIHEHTQAHAHAQAPAHARAPAAATQRSDGRPLWRQAASDAEIARTRARLRAAFERDQRQAADITAAAALAAATVGDGNGTAANLRYLALENNRGGLVNVSSSDHSSALAVACGSDFGACIIEHNSGLHRTQARPPSPPLRLRPRAPLALGDSDGSRALVARVGYGYGNSSSSSSSILSGTSSRARAGDDNDDCNDDDDLAAVLNSLAPKPAAAAAAAATAGRRHGIIAAARALAATDADAAAGVAASSVTDVHGHSNSGGFGHRGDAFGRSGAVVHGHRGVQRQPADPVAPYGLIVYDNSGYRCDNNIIEAAAAEKLISLIMWEP